MIIPSWVKAMAVTRKEKKEEKKIPKIVVTTFAAANRLHSDARTNTGNMN